MCEHCGCREFPLVKTFTEEHFAIHEVLGQLVRAIHDQDPAAPRLLDDLVRLLDAHEAREERSLYPELSQDEQFAEAIAGLRSDHARVDGALTRAQLDGIDPQTLLPALERLYLSIDKEEYGIFPAAVVLLGMDAWERATQAA